MNHRDTEAQRHRDKREKRQDVRCLLSLFLFFSLLPLCLCVSVVHELVSQTVKLGHYQSGERLASRTRGD